MKNLLQNKWAVGLLSVIALGAILLQNPSWLRPGSAAVAAREAEEADPSIESAVVTTNSPARYLTELANWRQLFPDSELRRDPFASRQRETPADTAVDPSGVGVVAIPFQLQAISIQGDRAFAVINRQVVAAGEKISGYTVDKITPREVVLTGEAGTRVLQIEFNAPPAARPGGDPADPESAVPAPQKPAKLSSPEVPTPKASGKTAPHSA
ncbi:MAG TPA: hypothetical protein DCM86_13290 [Verrucomicrobiales bacterium]|nr:hypothetical protein [Verrucomicrobiales bacterium]